METLVTFMRENIKGFYSYSYEFKPISSHSAAHRNYPWACEPNRWVYGDLPRRYYGILRKSDNDDVNDRST